MLLSTPAGQCFPLPELHRDRQPGLHRDRRPELHRDRQPGLRTGNGYLPYD